PVVDRLHAGRAEAGHDTLAPLVGLGVSRIDSASLLLLEERELPEVETVGRGVNVEAVQRRREAFLVEPNRCAVGLARQRLCPCLERVGGGLGRNRHDGLRNGVADVSCQVEGLAKRMSLYEII